MQTPQDYDLPSPKSRKAYVPTKDDVIELWKHFQGIYGTKIIDKDDAALMKFIATFLSLSPNMTKDDFLDRYVTTVGRKIYVPFEVGTPNEDSWSLWSQLVTCIHEHQHVEQYKGIDSSGSVDFSTQYLLKKRRRARFEWEAYTTALEMHYWRYGKTRSVDPLVRSLAGYQLDKRDLETARQVWERNNKMIAQGAIITKASGIAIEWFRSRGVKPFNER